jgi:hypothetical protein
MGITSRKLHSVKKKSLKNNISKISIKSETELLKLTQGGEYDDIFRTLGVTSKSDVAQDLLKDKTELDVFKEKFSDLESFKGHHIKRLCNSHDLMVRPISSVKGYLTSEAMKFIKEFHEKYEDSILSDGRFFILAGRECFYPSYKGKEVRTYIIFYKDRVNSIGSRGVMEEDTLTQVCSSGNDFSMVRRLYRFFVNKTYSSSNNMTMSMLTSNILISLILMFAIFLAWVSFPIAATVFFTLYLVSMWFNNSYFEPYLESWNKFNSHHENRYVYV